MRIDEAVARARALMDQHGLTGWRLVLDNAKTRAGVCRPGRKEIGLSRVLTPLHSEAEVIDTVLHEIAHALVGAEHGHDAVWRAKALQIGCSGARCVSADAARPQAPWTGTCPAGHEVRRHRQPVRVQSCRKCSPSFDLGALISWTKHGRPAPMHPRYVAEMTLITRRRSDPDVAAALVAVTTPRAIRQAPPPSLPVGARVRLGGRGRYAGLTGTIEKRGRTRYHVMTRVGLITAPFELVQRL